jgi:hypothetical protein
MKINAKRWRGAVLVMGIAVLTLAAVMTPVYAHDESGPGVFPKDSVIFGRTYGEWSAAWHQWADSMPWTNHPLFDTEDCSEGQSGPVWFLGGRFCGTEQPGCDSSMVKRTCKVPLGKALYFPIVNNACLDGETKIKACFDLEAPNIALMRDRLAGSIDPVKDLVVTVDGKPIKGNLKKDFRVQSVVYPTLVVDNSLFVAINEPGIVAGTYFGVDDGVYVMLEPLEKGKHTLKFKGTFPQYNFSLDVTYKLIVE